MNKRIIFALLLMGFTSLTVQTLLIREFLISFYGNELTIGLILANWILLEALGSSLANRASLRSKRPHLVYALLQAGITIYLPLSIFLIRNIKNMLGLTLGEGMGILPISLSSFLILAPLSLFDGAQFPFGCRILSDTSGRPLESTSRVYILEAMGFILAGPVFTYILIAKLNSFSIAFCLGILNLVSALFLLKDRLEGIVTKSFFIIINAVFILAVLTFLGPAAKLHQLSINKQWPGQKVLNYKNSIYGNLTVTKAANQYIFYSDGIPIITTPVPDFAYIEELVHFTMLSHPHPQNVLLLSGGAGGVIKEILKYPIEKLTYAELDPLLIKMIKSYPTELTQEELSDRRLDIRLIDGRRLVRLTKSSTIGARLQDGQESASGGKYDIVILNLPMPSTLQLNRFYTREFYQSVKSVLTEKGIFSFTLPGSLSYINPSLRNLNGSILNTLKDIFYVNIIPGDSNLYLAAKDEFKISPEVFLERLRQNNIPTRLLNKSHLEYRLNPSWLIWFNNSLADYSHIRKNFDLSPSATFYSISHWNNIFSRRLEGLFMMLDKLNFKVLMLILFIFGLALLILNRFVFKLKRLPVGFAVAATGFVGLTFELILIYTYQAFYGFVFAHLALLVTAFMSGLTLGGWLMTMRLDKIRHDLLSFTKIELAIIGFCVMVGPLLLYLGRTLSLNFSFVLFLLSAVSGYLVGSEFPLANKIYWQNKGYVQTSWILYALDLLGGWLAALAVSVVLVPVIGISKTCILLIGLKIISLTLLISNKT